MALNGGQIPRLPSGDQATRWLPGIPRQLIVLRILPAICTSPRWGKHSPTPALLPAVEPDIPAVESRQIPA